MTALFETEGQIRLAFLLMVITCMAWLVVPIPYAPLGMPLLLLGIIFALKQPFYVCLAFVLISCFRLHEAFPFLIKLKLPFAFGSLALISSLWHLFMARSMRVFWPAEGKALAVFFGIVTAGLIFAKTRSLAFDAWTGSLVKVVSITYVLMWITRRPREFEIASRGIVIAGCLLASVAIWNKLHGIGLVEGGRVTVGRDVDSPNGDPNLLSLTLLFPLSFAISLAFSQSGRLNRMLGTIGAGVIVLAIVFTQSRGGLIGVLAVAGVIGLRKVKSKTLVIVSAAVLGIALYAAMGISDRLSGAAGVSSSEAAETRIYSWHAAINMALSRPLTGVGLSNFESEYVFFTPVWLKQNYTAHSIWFLVLGEIGFPGLIAFAAMIVVTLRRGFRTLAILDGSHADERLKAIAVAIAAGLAGYCAAGTFLSASFAWPLYILLALSTALGQVTQESGVIPAPVQVPRRSRWAQEEDGLPAGEEHGLAPQAR